MYLFVDSRHLQTECPFKQWSIWCVYIIAITYICYLLHPSDHCLYVAVAYIDINGTDETVRVMLMADGTRTTWNTNTSTTSYSFSIHRLPTDHTSDPTRRCAVFASNASFVENLSMGLTGTVNRPLSDLVMCSIVATDSSSGIIRGCGTIMGGISEETIVARAVFYRPIGGTLYLIDHGGMCICMCMYACVCI